MLRSRRAFLQAAGSAVAASFVRGQSGARSMTVQTPALTVGYEDSGPPQGFPVILLHGFPDDVRAFDRVVSPLTAAGHRVLVPYLRGYGPTRLRDTKAPKMGQQSAIG